jgi:hypothetical protein
MGEKCYITTSLLSGWQWACKKDGGFDEFVQTLRKEPKPRTEAMENGIAFETLVNACISDLSIEPIPEWEKGVNAVSEVVKGSAMQVKLSKDIVVDGQPILLYGIADYVKAGVIYDCKFSKKYHNSKYLDSTQHPLYLECLPEADRFIYLSSDGENLWREEYRREDTPSIVPTIREFLMFLEKQGLTDLYSQNWKCKY